MSRAKTALIVCTAAFMIIMGLVTVRRSVKGSNDFDTFFQSGRAVLTGQGIYYSGEYYKTSDDIGPFLYPPPAACFFALLAWMPIKPAAFVWSLLNTLLFAASLKITLALQPAPERNSLFQKKSLRNPLAIFAFGLCSIFMMDNLSMAQVNILLYFLCVLGLLLVHKKRSFAAGLVFSLAIWLKVTPALFVLYFMIKRQTRVLMGITAGSLILAVLIPILVFGPETTRLYYRQWAGRMIKPGIVSALSQFKKFEKHPQKKSPEELRLIRLADMLTEKNQSLEAGLTRILLRNRNDFAFSTAFPIYAAQRYAKLPVLLGGLPWGTLNIFIKTLMAGMMGILLWVWSHRSQREDYERLGISLLFISLILFSPFARSHQFISLMFPLAVLLTLRESSGDAQRKICTYGAWIGGSLFLLQSIPLGKAAGLGTWAGVIFWISSLTAVISLRRTYSA